MPGALFLWDIDGTILVGNAREATNYQSLTTAVLGLAAQEPIPLVISGKTDLGIFHDYAHLLAPDRPLTPGQLESLLADLEDRTDIAIRTATPYRLLPGVQDFMAAASQRGALHSLLTGNTRRRAELKLESFGLWSAFDPTLSCFGQEAPHRPDLMTIVKRRIQRSPAVAFLPVFVIGDTPNDVLAAHSVGYPILAVCTGAFTAVELNAAGADYITDNLVSALDLLPELLPGTAA